MSSSAALRTLRFAAVLAVLYGLWEGFRWLGIHYHWQHPFPVDDTSMPHIHTIVKALFEQPTAGVGDVLIVQLFSSAANQLSAAPTTGRVVKAARRVVGAATAG